ncbi:P-loop NTPase fold protein, partial [bacterium]
MQPTKEKQDSINNITTISNRNDCLNRGEIIQNIMFPLIKDIKDPFVLAINAKWGNGKTRFIEMLRDSLKEIGDYKIVFYNAWEEDINDDPFVSILGKALKDLALPEETVEKLKLNNITKVLIKTL